MVGITTKQREALRLYEELGSQTAVAKTLGVTVPTVNERLFRAKQHKLDEHEKSLEVELPDFPSEDIPVEQIIGQMAKRFETRAASFLAHTWFRVKIKEDKPIGLLWFGDPHVDDNGCNWPVLLKHCELCKTTDGLYGANIGDTTNNWSGRLAHLYSKQDTSVGTAQRLAAWFMLESGVRWLIWLLGNHDKWGDGSAVLAQMAKRYGTHKVVCHDWEARFSLVFPNGVEFPVWAAHDFPGHSMWNPLHGPLKSGKFGKDASLLICGHKHNWGLFTYENPDRGIKQVLARVRGYKFNDDHARQLGINEQQGGCAILTVFDPLRNTVTAFDNIDDGVDFLKMRRKAA